MEIKIPLEAEFIINKLYEEGYEGFVVGGCVRDSLLNREVNDWDITTSANPEKVKEIFNEYKVIETGIAHGTVTILIDKEPYEVTTYRVEGEYSDGRRPDYVDFTSNIKEDLCRRDFTINAMAYNYKEGLVDYFNGVEDLNNRVIKCVGDPKKRFGEDGLRVLRAIRFYSTLGEGFILEEETNNAMERFHLKPISVERIREEFVKIIKSSNPKKAFDILMEKELIDYVIPELKYCYKFNQFNKHHYLDVYEHIMEVIKNTDNDLELRLSALLHDIGKPQSFTMEKKDNGKYIGHFYKHELLGRDMSIEILKRLKFDNKTVEVVSKLVFDHMTRDKKMGDKTLKNLIIRVGKENIDNLFKLQIADVKASNPPYDDYEYIIKLWERCNGIIDNKEPLTVKELAINGKDLINMGYTPGKELGEILNSLLDKVIDNPTLNKKEKLIDILKENKK